MIEPTRTAVFAFFLAALAIGAGGVAGYGWGHHDGAAGITRADKELAFVYACGYVDGQHQIMQITNMPGPHKPSSAELCRTTRAMALASGFKSSQ